MLHRISTAALIVMIGSLASAQEKPKPDFADVRYGPHERNVLDFWRSKATAPAPVVLYIHGGGFRRGDKNSLSARRLEEYLSAGFAVAAINYRLTDTAPFPAQYLDCARALQYVRSRAKEWNIDARLVASTGGSAGAGTSMWLAFRDDLADPQNPDPVLRQSTRLTCIAVENGQSSYDPRFAESIGIPRPNFERHPFFLPFYGIDEQEIDTPKAYRLYDEAAPITFLTRDDPPVYLSYNRANVPADASSDVQLVVHHPRLGIALKQRMDKLGIECVLRYPDHPGGEPIQPLAFIKKHIEKARKSK
jgi:acetyl esterase/lipase